MLLNGIAVQLVSTLDFIGKCMRVVLFLFLSLECWMIYASSSTVESTALGLANHVHLKRTSVSIAGAWKPSKNPEEECGNHFLCTPSNMSWQSETKFYDHINGCDALLSHGIRKIYFHGDSFMRQMYQGLFITLSGNYRSGSMVNSEASRECEFHKQFNEKKCGVRQLNHTGLVCGGRILLDPLLIGLDNPSHCSADEKNVILWSFGNYKTGRHGRHGVNNATAYSQLFDAPSGPCPKIAASNNPKCKIWWISTHFRMRGIFSDETPDIIKAYNEGMRSFFEAEPPRCGAVNYLDVYNMTRQLGAGSVSGVSPVGSVDLSSEAAKMTYDNVHWGMEVNLVKAQMIINAILSNN